jgi:hypothetical protein
LRGFWSGDILLQCLEETCWGLGTHEEEEKNSCRKKKKMFVAQVCMSVPSDFHQALSTLIEIRIHKSNSTFLLSVVAM